jgi:glycosyltransferase involved in cell wall biosynthesis
MNIAVTVDPEIPVPPALYGGIERIVDMLVHGLVERGHTVTLFAHPDSEVPCTLMPYPGRRSQAPLDLARNTAYVSSRIVRGGFDIVHSHARLAYLLPLMPLSIPKVMSYGRRVSQRSVRWGNRLARGSLSFTGVSRHIVDEAGGGPNWHVVYNGVPVGRYTLQPAVLPDAPLVFLGRIEAIKGPHLAIEIARRAGRSLVLAGNIPEQGATFFEQEIRPRLDGKAVQYVGPVDDVAKNRILGGAAALLMPILWDEPYGMVMAEAMACGTPVIGLHRGAVPEVVQDGVNGFDCDTLEGMVAAVARIGTIDRRVCRIIMEERFSDRVMVDAYEKLYFRLVEHRRRTR